MREIKNQEDFNEIFFYRNVALSFHNDWSAYSHKGLKNLEEAEVFLSGNSSLNASFYFADVSCKESPASFTLNWLNEIHSESSALLKSIVAGNFAIIWLTEGRVVEYKSFAHSLLPSEIADITYKVFA